jgi:catalase
VDEDYYSQPGALYRLMTPSQQQALFDNTARAINGARKEVIALHIEHCSKADAGYGAGVAHAIEALQSRRE